MGFIERLSKHIQPPSLPSSFDDVSQRASRFSPRNLLRRRVRLRTISAPLAVVLVFPFIAVILILVLFLRHPASPGRVLIPSGSPPSIRSVHDIFAGVMLKADRLKADTMPIRRINERQDRVFVTGCLEPERQITAPRANAVFVVLARNKELDGVLQSIKSIERHFNRWFHYPYVFLNDGDFNSTFKETITNYTSAPVEFGKIEPSMWGYPDWVDKEVAREGIRKQGDAAIMYGGMESYHHMCRFYSGWV